MTILPIFMVDFHCCINFTCTRDSVDLTCIKTIWENVWMACSEQNIECSSTFMFTASHPYIFSNCICTRKANKESCTYAQKIYVTVQIHLDFCYLLYIKNCIMSLKFCVHTCISPTPLKSLPKLETTMYAQSNYQRTCKAIVYAWLDQTVLKFIHHMRTHDENLVNSSSNPKWPFYHSIYSINTRNLEEAHAHLLPQGWENVETLSMKVN